MIQGLLLCLRKCLEVGFTSRLGEFVSGEVTSCNVLATSTLSHHYLPTYFCPGQSQQDLASPVQNRICLASSVMDSRGPELSLRFSS
ncbi:uncharacterized protein RSE6_08311 [Rhynchosporium secalis]|uniref:Uncharacterized protein n=1 Tax=Rhynchosporium secalis TaxID=38038 RepID=A0A1E1MFA6_RHYSE|nr:uncharacterized protein RSE6_08311 [Rhynchosporium secalis]